MPINQNISFLPRKILSKWLSGKSINFNKRKMKAVPSYLIFPLLKLIDWFAWAQDFSGKDRNLDSHWSAQIISTQLKCRLRYRLLIILVPILIVNYKLCLITKTKTYQAYLQVESGSPIYWIFLFWLHFKMVDKSGGPDIWNDSRYLSGKMCRFVLYNRDQKFPAFGKRDWTFLFIDHKRWP